MPIAVPTKREQTYPTDIKIHKKISPNNSKYTPKFLSILEKKKL